MGKIRNKIFNFFKRFKHTKPTFDDIDEVAQEYNIPRPKRNPSENLPSDVLLEPQKMYDAEYELARVNRMLSGEYFQDIAKEEISNMMATIEPFLSDETNEKFENLTEEQKIDFYNLAVSDTILGRTESIMYSDTEILNIVYHTHEWDKLYVLTDTFDRLLDVYNEYISKYEDDSSSQIQWDKMKEILKEMGL